MSRRACILFENVFENGLFSSKIVGLTIVYTNKFKEKNPIMMNLLARDDYLHTQQHKNQNVSLKGTQEELTCRKY